MPINKRRTLAFSLLLIVTSTSFSQESFSLKHFTKYLNSSINSSASNSLRFTRTVHYKRWIDDDMVDDYVYQIVCNKDKNNAFFAIEESSRVVVLGKDYYNEINVENRELTSIKNKKKGRRYYTTLRYNEEKKHYCLHYYLYSMPKMITWSLPKITSYKEEIVRGKSTHKYIAKDTYKSTSSNGTKTDVSETTTIWIDPQSLEIDSIICKITQYVNGKPLVITHKEYITASPSNDFEAFEKLLDFNNPKYKGYSMHNENNLPYSHRYSDNKDLNEQILNFPLIDLKGKQTAIQQLHGWILLDFWQFGCPSCFVQFKKYALENDSIGTTILEQNDINILCIHPYSDNMEMIGKIGEKYGVSKYLYSAKGINDQLEIISYPTYYLISPDKQIILKTNQIDDYLDILRAIKNQK